MQIKATYNQLKTTQIRKMQKNGRMSEFMKAVHFGAGKIGRGFIADLLHETGYEITFVDVNEGLNKELNEFHNYYLYVIEEGYRRRTIDKVTALSPITQETEVTEAIAKADLITTAVLADNFSKIASNLAIGLKVRSEIGERKVNVIPCENALLNGDMLKKEVLKTGIITEKELDLIATFPNTAVDRMVFDAERDGRKGIDIGRDYELVIQKDLLVDSKNCPIKGAEYTNDLNKYLERKLYVINGGHAWSGYIAHVMGYKIIQDYFAKPENVQMTKDVMIQIGAVLEKRYGFTHQEMIDYIEFAMNRFLTPGVVDTVKRISRAPIRKLGANDRLLGPAFACEKLGLPNDLILKGVAAVFLFDEKEDEQSMELMEYVKKYGIENAIQRFTGIDRDSRMYSVILKEYLEMCR